MRALVIVPLLLAGTAAQAREEHPFNGRDLSGWEFNVGSEGSAATTRRPIESVWAVRDGAIACLGGARNGGWLHTARSYTNFVLTLEFRWGEIDPAVKAAGRNPYNSGIFFRSNPRVDQNMVVPFYYQAQIIHTPARPNGEAGGGTGDIWLIGYDHPGFKGASPENTPNFSNRPMPPGVAPAHSFPRLKFAEKPIGEWNVFEIRADHDKLTYTLNGEVVNRGTGAGVVPGKIGLECENTPIFFRNIRVNTLP